MREWGGEEFNPKKNKKKFDKRRKGGRNAWLFKFAWYCLIKLVVQQVEGEREKFFDIAVEKKLKKSNKIKKKA